MRNISIHPWDRPMWTDSPTPLHEQFGMTAMEARLGRWCFGGPGDDGNDAVDDVEKEGEDINPDTDLQGRSNRDDPETDEVQDPESNVAVAERADAAAAAGITDDFDALSTDAPSVTADKAADASSAVGDLDSYSSRDAAQAAMDIATASVSGNVADLSGFDTAAVDEAVNQLNEVGEVSIGYNDLAGFKDEDGFGIEFGPKQESYFDRKEDDIQRADQAIAKAIQDNAKAQGRDVNVSVDAQGQLTYTAGPRGTAADVAAVQASQMAQGFATLGSMATPTGLAMSALNPDLFNLGLSLAPTTGKFSPTTATKAALSERQGTFDRGQGAGPAVMGMGAAQDLGLATVTQADATTRQSRDPNKKGFTDLNPIDLNLDFGVNLSGSGVDEFGLPASDFTSLSPDSLSTDAPEFNATEAAIAAQDISPDSLSTDGGGSTVAQVERDAEREKEKDQQYNLDPTAMYSAPGESPGLTEAQIEALSTDLFDELQRQAAQTAAEREKADAEPSARSFGIASGISDPIAMRGVVSPDNLLAEDVDLLGSLLEEEESEQTPVVIKPEEEKTPTDPVEEITPRPFEILPFAASTPFTPSTQFGQVVPFTRNLEYTRPGGIADLQRQLAILNRRLFT